MRLFLSVCVLSPMHAGIKKELCKEHHHNIIQHFYDKIFIYSRNAKLIPYDTIIEKKPYLENNPYDVGYGVLVHHVKPNIIFRLFMQNNCIVFACKENSDSKRYFIDNDEENLYYVLNDQKKTCKEFHEANIPEDTKELNDFIAWILNKLYYVMTARMYDVDNVFLDKLEKFYEHKD